MRLGYRPTRPSFVFRTTAPTSNTMQDYEEKNSITPGPTENVSDSQCSHRGRHETRASTSTISSKCGTFFMTRLNGDSSWLIECFDEIGEEPKADHHHSSQSSASMNIHTGEEISGSTSGDLHKCDRWISDEEKLNERSVVAKNKTLPQCRIVLDPWLESSPGIDGCACFSSTFQTTPAVHVDDILAPSYSSENGVPSVVLGVPTCTDINARHILHAIVVSLPFSDHCHEDTLDTFPASISIIAANGSYKRLKSHFGDSRNIINLPQSDCNYPSCAIRIPGTSFDIVTVQSKFGMLDPTHRGICIVPTRTCTASANVCINTPGSAFIPQGNLGVKMNPEAISQGNTVYHKTKNTDKSGLLYAPHGLRLSSSQKSKISSFAPKGLCLLSTITLYELPLMLGGTVNLGMENAAELISDLKNVTDFIPTHSPKETRQYGLVTSFSRVKTVDVESVTILETMGKNIMRIAKKPE